MIVSGPVDGPPVVLLHALFHNCASWYRNVEALSSETYRTVLASMSSERRTREPSQPNHLVVGRLLEWFTELINQLGIDALYLVGDSYGGFTAALLSNEAPRWGELTGADAPGVDHPPNEPVQCSTCSCRKGCIWRCLHFRVSNKLMRSSVDWMHAGLPHDPLWEPLFYETMRHGNCSDRVFPRIIYDPNEFADVGGGCCCWVTGRCMYGDLKSAIRAGKDLIPKSGSDPVGSPRRGLCYPEVTNRELLRFFAD